MREKRRKDAVWLHPPSSSCSASLGRENAQLSASSHSEQHPRAGESYNTESSRCRTGFRLLCSVCVSGC
ncbi:hypothetical protein XELAEV_18011921mg [Xenopus laevis]|uniref:Uncharacterized protein n=1 Tax=Xenopus laevis TaxID=8355 RepID=A0A974DLM5_XENLA|nr:hypothetical protein XELAEV_18011921mg [Xenopus laevis]